MRPSLFREGPRDTLRHVHLFCLKCSRSDRPRIYYFWIFSSEEIKKASKALRAYQETIKTTRLREICIQFWFQYE